MYHDELGARLSTVAAIGISIGWRCLRAGEPCEGDRRVVSHTDPRASHDPATQPTCGVTGTRTPPSALQDGCPFPMSYEPVSAWLPPLAGPRRARGGRRSAALAG
jgi:hypothetical protein